MPLYVLQHWQLRGMHGTPELILSRLGTLFEVLQCMGLLEVKMRALPIRPLLVVLMRVGFSLCLLLPISASASTESVLYSFLGTSDGQYPSSALVRDSQGNLYGTTEQGGANGFGTVYELSPNPEGGWTETVIHNFNANGVDGYSPNGGLTFDAAGNLYGTTEFGGTDVYGIVFELSPTKSGSWTETILHNFTDGDDGGAPQYGSLIFDKNGNVYGTTQNGGLYGGGVAFELSQSPEDVWTETVLYAFAETIDNGYAPMAVVFDKQGNLYGTTYGGGAYSRGVVFELSLSGGTWSETILHNFDDGTDGGTPRAGVVFHGSDLYGTTENGGSGALGTVYRLSKTKTGWKEKVLHNFTGGNDGLAPEGSVVFDKTGHLYSTTYGGGADGAGTVFELEQSKGVWTETILYNFTGKDDGGWSAYGLILDKAGNLYGAAGGGSTQNGVVFEVTP